VVSDFNSHTAAALGAEFDWFYGILDTRIKLHFGHECAHKDIVGLTPPVQDPGSSSFGGLLQHYGMNFEERVVMALLLAAHLRPQMLDAFFTKNAALDREFTEFGGRPSHRGFLPTGETALFLLAGDDLGKRLAYGYLFEAEHYFSRHGIIGVESPPAPETPYSGALILSRDILDFITLGRMRKPTFGMNFPAKPLETNMVWKDLVLDANTLEQIMEIKAWIDHGGRLLGDLGLGRKMKPGYRSLFYGPSGTGKTLTAALLGKATGRDVYRVDLSLVISKYIGETEKNLEKVFQQAEHRDWILFFDEAEAIFGKRTNVSDSHDRFANQEVSYLLQRVEDYPGVVILASNLKSNMDDAFTRRFQSIISFPLPRTGERLQLWKGAFSPKTSLEQGIDLTEVAGKYELSGGAIMNVVRYATLMTLVRGSEIIAWRDFKEGIRKEYQKEGKTF
jgi:hypothetical protein